MLAIQRQLAEATNRQAFNELSLYQQVLRMELTWLQQVVRSPDRNRVLPF